MPLILILKINLTLTYIFVLRFKIMALNLFGKNGSLAVIILAAVSLLCIVFMVLAPIVGSEMLLIVGLSLCGSLMPLIFGILNFLENKGKQAIIAMILSVVVTVLWIAVLVSGIIFK